jgi:hypothetical protein
MIEAALLTSHSQLHLNFTYTADADILASLPFLPARLPGRMQSAKNTSTATLSHKFTIPHIGI